MALPASDQIAVVDLGTLKVAHIIKVGSHPVEVLTPPGSNMAYVSCMAQSQVAVIDTSQWKVQKMIDTGKGADGLAWIGAGQ